MEGDITAAPEPQFPTSWAGWVARADAKYTSRPSPSPSPPPPPHVNTSITRPNVWTGRFPYINNDENRLVTWYWHHLEDSIYPDDNLYEIAAVIAALLAQQKKLRAELASH